MGTGERVLEGFTFLELFFLYSSGPEVGPVHRPNKGLRLLLVFFRHQQLG